MNTPGFQAKFTKLWHRVLASYFRALGAAVTTVQIIAASAPKGIALNLLQQFGAAAAGALIAPAAVFFTEAGNLLDDPGDPPPPQP